jgi:thiamine-monophosphate kinase
MKTRKPDARPGEFELIEKLFAPLARNAPGALGLGDDVAVLAPPAGVDVLLKTDAIVESVDFFREDPADLVAQKALRVNLSDLAAKGAEPAGYLLTLFLPEWPDLGWLESFAQGLARDQAEFGLSLMGGDMSSTPGPLAVSVSAYGFVPSGAMIRRAGARAGDCVFVSGTIGDSGGGLSVLKGEALAAEHQHLITRYRTPQPRLALGRALRGVASAALDVSDGLLADLGHLARASGVAISIDATRIPLSADLMSLWGDDLDARCRAAAAGDDYEIAFAAPSAARDAVMAVARQVGVAVSEIGRVEEGQGVRLLDVAGREIPVPHKGFTHF